LSQEAEIEGR